MILNRIQGQTFDTKKEGINSAALQGELTKNWNLDGLFKKAPNFNRKPKAPKRSDSF
jgi:hypothetical protein